METPQVRKDGQLVVSAKVTNTSEWAGDEIVQLYVQDLVGQVTRPVKELKGFRRVSLEPGQSEKVSFTIDRDAMSFFDPGKDDWIAEAGVFEVLVGASSREIRLKGSFRLLQE